MITEEFRSQTDELIQAFKSKIKSVENGNIIIARIKFEEKTKGGLILSKGLNELEQKRAGFGRVLAVARNIVPLRDGEMTGDPEVEVGDYVFYVHDAIYKPSHVVLESILEVKHDETMIWSITDKEVIAVVR